MSDVLVISPLGVEALAVRSARRGLRVHSTGMGPYRARAAVPALLADPAAALLIVGFGGGLASDSQLCDVVVADRVVEVGEDGRPIGDPIACAAAEQLARLLAARGLRACGGTVASVQEIVTGRGRERMLASGAVAVDMESAWVAAAARERPFAVVRVLSDTPRHELRRRLPVGPPLPSAANAARAIATLRRVAIALGHGGRGGELHTVLGVDAGERGQV